MPAEEIWLSLMQITMQKVFLIEMVRAKWRVDDCYCKARDDVSKSIPKWSYNDILCSVEENRLTQELAE